MSKYEQIGFYHSAIVELPTFYKKFPTKKNLNTKNKKILIQQNQRIILSSVQNALERCKIAKILLWTELGHNLQKFRLVGSNFGLLGL